MSDSEELSRDEAEMLKVVQEFYSGRIRSHSITHRGGSAMLEVRIRGMPGMIVNLSKLAASYRAGMSRETIRSMFLS